MSKASQTRSLNRAKNLARGALASLKGGVYAVHGKGDAPPIKRKSAWDARQTSMFILNSSLSKARSGLSGSDLEEFNAWLGSLQSKLDMQANSIGTPLAALGILPTELSSTDLNQELFEAVRRLVLEKDQLIDFANRARSIADSIESNNFSNALDKVKRAGTDFGYSFWYVENYLALTALTSGVDRLKEEVVNISIQARGYQRFIFHSFGVRNEPAQSAARFRSTTRKTISQSKFSEPLKTYLSYRLCAQLELNVSAMASALAYEQTTTLIDLFFTLIRVCTIITTQKRYFSEAVVAAAEIALASLEGIDSDDLQSFCRLPSGKIKELAVDAITLLFQNEIDEDDAKAGSAPARAIASQLLTRGSQLASDEASKTFLNFSWLPIALSLGEIQKFPSLSELLLETSDTSFPSPLLFELRQLVTRRSQAQFPEPTNTALKTLWRLYELRSTGSNNDILVYLRERINSPASGPEIEVLQVLYAHALYDADDRKACVDVCADAGRANEHLLPFLPLAGLFVGKRWTELNRLGPSVNLAIAISHACKIIEEDKLRTFKRYAVEELLAHHHGVSISGLIPKLAEGIAHETVAYFGYYVCDIATLELLPGVNESRLAQRTRAQVLECLAALNSQRAVIFETEAQTINDALQVDDGLSVLDDSKVHVDEEAVVNYVVSEYRADFQRYKQLVASGVGVAESITDILKNLDEPTARIFQIPKNDADDLLVQLTNNILQRFLYDPAAGLDIIIGRRIRHNTISSELRGVLEKDELIGIIHNGRYEPAPAFIRFCGSMAVNQRKNVYGANARFSKAIDQIVALLRDHYFNVRSRTKPRGVFDLSINSVLFALVRSAAQTCNTLDQFARECIDSFWMFLSFRLETYRTDVESEVRKQLRLAYQKFLLELSSQHVAPQLFSTVQRSAEELERRATTIASWIGVPKVRLEFRSYALDKTVDIAIAVVSGQIPGFKPIVTKKIYTQIELDSRGFSIVSDALYVAIDNIAQHSGMRSGNQVNVEIDFDSERSVLTFMIECDVTAAARKGDKTARLQAIKQDIQRKTFVEGARKNKHSGLYKLAALVYQSKKTTFSADFCLKNRFCVCFELEYIPLSTSEICV